MKTSTSQSHIEIVVLAQKLLRWCWLIPFEWDSMSIPWLLTFLRHLEVFFSGHAAFAFAVGQASTEVVNVFASIDALIGYLNYLVLLYLSICYYKHRDEFNDVLKGIHVFSQFCDVEVIFKTERRVHRYTKYLAHGVCWGIFYNWWIPLINIKYCWEKRDLSRFANYTSCGTMAPGLYPFQTRQLWIAILLNIDMTIAVIVVCIGFFGFTTVFVGLTMHIMAQIDNLKSKLKSVFDLDSNHQQMVQQFHYCIAYHEAIINYTEKVFRAFNAMLLAHISFPSFTLAIVIYILTAVEDYFNRMKYTALLTGWIVLLFITCYYSQRLTEESVYIADAVQSSDWYNAPTDLQKSVGLMILRAQKPLTMKAASIGTVTLSTFVSVIKMTYSVSTLLFAVSD